MSEYESNIIEVNLSYGMSNIYEHFGSIRKIYSAFSHVFYFMSLLNLRLIEHKKSSV